MKFNKLEESVKGDYLKFKDSESVVVVPRGEIFSFKIRWEGGKSTVIDEPDTSRHNRFKMNVVVKEPNGFVVKTWEYGITVYNTLAEFATEMDITSSKIKVTRKGTGTDTVYVLVPLGALDTASLKAISSLPLNILSNKPKAKDEHPKDEYLMEPPPAWTTEEAPYDNSDLPF